MAYEERMARRLSGGQSNDPTSLAWENPRMNITERLAHVIVETTDADLPDEAMAQGKRALLDTIGVTLAGYDEASAQVIMAWVAESPSCSRTSSPTLTR